jgi:D-tyrosyl-tRNA(Tyr) deacylase
VVSKIDNGLLLLVGISTEDTPNEIDWMARKVLNVRVFDGDNEKPWAKNVMDKQFQVLSVSQFTLYGQLNGNKARRLNANYVLNSKSTLTN